MPINASGLYYAAEQKHALARTNEEKLKALQEMLKEAPKHKGSEGLLSEIKSKISKIKKLMEKERTSKKGGFTLSIKREGAAQVVLVGTTNTGKSTFLNQMTNTKIAVAEYPFTTKKPEIGTFDYKGVKIQMIEVPAITKNFEKTEMGPTFLSIIKHADLIVLFFNSPEEKKMLDKELYEINLPFLIFNNQKNIGDIIWEKLDIIKVYTKQPGKKPDYPPMAMDKNSTVRDVAERIHKDFLAKIGRHGSGGTWARIFGNSAKFKGQKVGMDHSLADDDIVELHLDKRTSNQRKN
ncbi:MAG: GTPase [Candidatus Nanoarchaeia archaeon]|nr:GTPase [Candidatus Nanoarchaeia archaeon]